MTSRPPMSCCHLCRGRLGKSQGTQAGSRKSSYAVRRTGSCNVNIDLLQFEATVIRGAADVCIQRRHHIQIQLQTGNAIEMCGAELTRGHDDVSLTGLRNEIDQLTAARRNGRSVLGLFLPALLEDAADAFMRCHLGLCCWMYSSSDLSSNQKDVV